MRIIGALTVAVFLIAACGGDDDEVTSGTDGTDAPADTTGQTFTVTATVLESPDHGPQLCLGGVAESLPPQCGGPDITNWNWDDVEADSAQGTTWGDYSFVGTYDAEAQAFSLTQPPAAPEPPTSSMDDDRFATPCAEPDGGWHVVDESRASASDQEAAADYAQQQPGHAGFWIDWIDPFTDDEIMQMDENGQDPRDDPSRYVINVRFIGDVGAHEAELREIWGGALCVSEANLSLGELRTIQDEAFSEVDGALPASVDETTGRVMLGVIVDDGTLQAEFDERYGEGVVVVSSALQPVD